MKYWLSLGSNIEPRIWYVKKALEFISELSQVLKVSPVYESESFGFDSYDFINVCALIDTDLMPETLLKFLKMIEVRLGRDIVNTYSSRFFFRPRPIDIDIILWENGKYEKEGVITIPHPEFHKRKFVLIPLIEMGEDVFHPTIMKRLSQILSEIDDTSWIIKIMDSLF